LAGRIGGAQKAEIGTREQQIGANFFQWTLMAKISGLDLLAKANTNFWMLKYKEVNQGVTDSGPFLAGTE
jgi:hypothetical protein